ncbi:MULTISPECIES: hypothetical protein [Arthrobacter]|uniref:Uncharacterized protein n=1 Tax=Arthrobacter terricola TaxID=2547396 RepID=A0A4R5KM58_9MICC|nr:MULTISPECIES: hypothetical protein [Arthrobacter]MBT8161426.1 hypothetical protein [Arthrobacter sp. GN70]TDF95600.1 hypothetical protein E1809_11275 [Arthrobacter terricola]
MDVTLNTEAIGEAIVGYSALFVVVLFFTLFVKYGKQYASFFHQRRLERLMEIHMRRQQAAYKAARTVYEREYGRD